MTEAEKAYQYFVIAVPENEEQAKAYFWARKALQSTLTQPNEPLTLEKLENMEDTTPVWWDQINSWVLVYKGNLTTWSGKHLYAKGCNGKFYRRPPEGEEETP